MSGKREVKQLKAERNAMQRRAEAAEEDWQRAEETIDALAEKLREANDEILTRGAKIERLKALLREWLAAYLEDYGEPDPTTYLYRLDRVYLATKDVLAAVRAVQEEKP